MDRLGTVTHLGGGHEETGVDVGDLDHLERRVEAAGGAQGQAYFLNPTPVAFVQRAVARDHDGRGGQRPQARLHEPPARGVECWGRGLTRPAHPGPDQSGASAEQVGREQEEE